MRKEEQGPLSRVAVISVHTSPQDQPGVGDSGGMNVYIRAVARRLAEQGIAVDVYTRCRGDGRPDVEEISPGGRLIRVQAGPCAPVPKEDLPGLLPDFLGGVLTRAAIDDPADARNHSPYDVVHSHYWLSGWVGSRAKEIWGVPHVASFHTLGKVKNSSLAMGDRIEPAARLRGEERVVAAADRILAPTPAEAAYLVGSYGASADRIRVVSPGVDRVLFRPRPKEEAKARLGLPAGRLVLFVGRLQPLKGPDVALRAMAEAVRRDPRTMSNAVLAVVGGPSGRASEAGREEVPSLVKLAASEGISDRVLFFPPQPHERLVEFYSAADVLLMPSRSESFGLVALEAQACGTPVLASAVGGLRYVVRDGASGFLVGGQAPRAFADRILAILGDERLARRLSLGALSHAGRFSWDATASEIRGVYEEVARRKAA
jgi:D-inositol-3-phosphate glycosyltransferase